MSGADKKTWFFYKKTVKLRAKINVNVSEAEFAENKKAFIDSVLKKKKETILERFEKDGFFAAARTFLAHACDDMSDVFISLDEVRDGCVEFVFRLRSEKPQNGLFDDILKNCAVKVLLESKPESDITVDDLEITLSESTSLEDMSWVEFHASLPKPLCSMTRIADATEEYNSVLAGCGLPKTTLPTTQQRVLLVVGPQGVGKSTLFNRLLGVNLFYVPAPLSTDVGTVSAVFVQYGPEFTATIEPFQLSEWEVARKDPGNSGDFFDTFYHPLLEVSKDWKNLAKEPEALVNLLESSPVVLRGADAESLSHTVNSFLEETVGDIKRRDVTKLVKITAPSSILFSITLVDCPGFGDAHPLRNNLWRPLLQRASYVVVLGVKQIVLGRQEYDTLFRKLYAWRPQFAERVRIVIREALTTQEAYGEKIYPVLYKALLTARKNEGEEVQQLTPESVRCPIICLRDDGEKELTPLRELVLTIQAPYIKQLAGVLGRYLDHLDALVQLFAGQTVPLDPKAEDTIKTHYSEVRKRADNYFAAPDRITPEILRTAYSEACLNLGRLGRGAAPFATDLRFAINHRTLYVEAANVLWNIVRHTFSADASFYDGLPANLVPFARFPVLPTLVHLGNYVDSPSAGSLDIRETLRLENDLLAESYKKVAGTVGEGKFTDPASWTFKSDQNIPKLTQNLNSALSRKIAAARVKYNEELNQAESETLGIIHSLRQTHSANEQLLDLMRKTQEKLKKLSKAFPPI